MGCVACVDSITNELSLNKKDVLSAKVYLDEKRARVRLAAGAHSGEVGLKLCEAVEAIGFPAKVLRVVELPEGNAAGEKKVKKSRKSDGTGSFMSQLTQAVAAGLLGSSCCLLQLGLNWLSVLDVLHVGCAGFNTYLGPLRIYIRSITFCWLGFLWFRALRSSNNATAKFVTRLTVQTILTLALTFLPELLKYSGGPAIAPPTDQAVERTFVVDNMGCE